MFDINIDLPSNDNNNHDSSKFLLDEGMYSAVCVGITLKEMQNFDKTGVEDKLQYIYQITEGEKVYWLRTKPMKPSFHEKSALYKFLASWTKRTTPAAVHELCAGNPANLVGKPIQLIIESSDYNGKTYNNIKDCMAPKANQSTEYTKVDFPEFLVDGTKQSHFLDGLKVKSPEPITPDESKKLDDDLAGVAKTLDGDLPF